MPTRIFRCVKRKSDGDATMTEENVGLGLFVGPGRRRHYA